MQLLHAPANYFDLPEKDISGQYCERIKLPALIYLFAAGKSIFEKRWRCWTSLEEIPALLSG